MLVYSGRAYFVDELNKAVSSHSLLERLWEVKVEIGLWPHRRTGQGVQAQCVVSRRKQRRIWYKKLILFARLPEIFEGSNFWDFLTAKIINPWNKHIVQYRYGCAQKDRLSMKIEPMKTLFYACTCMYLGHPAVRPAELWFQSSWSCLRHSKQTVGYSEALSWGQSTACGKYIIVIICRTYNNIIAFFLATIILLW